MGIDGAIVTFIQQQPPFAPKLVNLTVNYYLKYLLLNQNFHQITHSHFYIQFFLKNQIFIKGKFSPIFYI